jgi:hypothetical protein
MGSHQRDWVEIAEKSVADGLNGLKQNKYITKIVNTIRSKIGTDYIKAIWVGGEDYKNPGDVHVLTSDDIIKIELKFSYKKLSGTPKNFGSKIFKKKIDSSIKSYQEYDEELGLKEQRYSLLEKKINKKIKTAKEYETILRVLRDRNDPIIKQIEKITEPGQEQYATYASKELNKYLDNVNKLTNELLNINEIDSSQQDVVYCVIKQFESENQSVEFFDFTDMNKKIVGIVASKKSIKFYNSNGKDVVRFSVNWKNICQGGKGPSFNVFIGNAFKG